MEKARTISLILLRSGPTLQDSSTKLLRNQCREHFVQGLPRAWLFYRLFFRRSLRKYGLRYLCEYENLFRSIASKVYRCAMNIGALCCFITSITKLLLNIDAIPGLWKEPATSNGLGYALNNSLTFF